MRHGQPVLYLAIVAVLVGGCGPSGSKNSAGGGNGSTASTSSNQPSIGTEAWSKYGELMTYTASGWQDTGWFRGSAQQGNVTLLSYNSTPNTCKPASCWQLKYKLGPDENGLTWVYDYDAQTQYAQDDSTKQIYIYTSDGRLLTPAEYANEQAQARAQAQAQPVNAPPSSPPQPTGSSSLPPSAPAAAQTTYEQEQEFINSINERAMAAVVAPECTYSYNGCGP
jgi:hypothetical protein